MKDLAALDVALHNTPRMTYGACVRWMTEMRDEITQLRSGKQTFQRVLTVLQKLQEKQPGSDAQAVALLREHGLVPLEKAPEPPLDQKRKEFMEFWRKAKPEQRKQLEVSAKAGNDSVLLAEIEKEKSCPA